MTLLTAQQVADSVKDLLAQGVHVMHIRCDTGTVVEFGHRSTVWWLKVATGVGEVETDGAKYAIDVREDPYRGSPRVRIAVGYKGGQGLAEHGSATFHDYDVVSVEAVQ